MAVGAFMASAALAGQESPAHAAGLSPAPRVAWVGAPLDAAQASSAGTRPFNIAEGPLATVLAAFEQATALTIVIDPARIEGTISPGAVGTFTVEEALRRILEGTNLRSQVVDAGTVLIDTAVAEFVEVVTAGHQSARAKNNRQIPEASPAGREVGEMVLHGLNRHPLFISAALPLRVFPPLCNRYEGGESFGNLQSMIRDDGQRTLLFDLDTAIQRIGPDSAHHAAVVQLTGVYHNLLRQWAEL